MIITWISGHVGRLSPAPTAIAPLRKVGPRLRVRLENLRPELLLERGDNYYVMSPDYEDSEDNTLRTIFDDFKGVLANILRQEGSTVRHTGQQTDLQWL